VPMTDSSQRVTGFTGFSEVDTANLRTELFADSAAAGSTLLDSTRQAWTYVEGCKTFALNKYDSPQGAIFEANVRDDDVSTCHDNPKQRLAAFGGRQFPHPAVQDTTRPGTDCHGPIGSMTSLRDDRASAVHGGTWTTWDGCTVRDDVINSKNYDACGFAGVRTITVADPLGARLQPGGMSLTYLYVPNGTVVPNNDVPVGDFPLLPPGAIDTGLREGVNQLWTVPTDHFGIYVVRGVGAERWPLTTSPPSC